MMEAEWLTGDDPAAMLYQLLGREPEGDQTEWGRMACASDRKLRLYACACAGRMKAFGADITPEALEENHYPAAASSALAWADDRAWRGSFPPAEKAALLRDILGNVFRPVTLPKGPPLKCPRCDGDGWVATPDGLYASREACKVCDGVGTLGLFAPCPWLTPDVMRLARAAYEERGQKCDAGCIKMHGRTEWVRYDSAGPDSGWFKCEACHGTGRIDGGTLDPLRLMILADCLEESGCASAELLAHLRSTGPHVRGCWALDCVLGKS